MKKTKDVLPSSKTTTQETSPALRTLASLSNQPCTLRACLRNFDNGEGTRVCTLAEIDYRKVTCIKTD